MSEHSHLDSQRRPPGECEGCDEEWAQQRARLSQIDPRVRAERSLDELARREGKLGAQRYGHKPGR